jgi:hypothetical protein
LMHTVAWPNIEPPGSIICGGNAYERQLSTNSALLVFCSAQTAS